MPHGASECVELCDHWHNSGKSWWFGVISPAFVLCHTVSQWDRDQTAMQAETSFFTSFSSGWLWWQQSIMTCWTVVSLNVMIFCTIPLLQHEPTQKWNVEHIWLLPLCKEELVEDCPCPPSKYSQGSLAVVSNHINYIGTPKLEDKKNFFVPTWYAEFLLH